MSGVRAFVDDGLGNSSYLVDAGGGFAFVVDPRRDVEIYLRAAREAGLRIEAVFETHLHADFVSGAPALAARASATAYAPAGAAAEWGRGAEPGERVRVGESTVVSVATPGHTPEHLAWVAERPGAEALAFTGGAILPGGVARTDLISPELTEPLARAARRSGLSLLAALDPSARILPTHGGGSFCSAAPPSGATRDSTVAAERAQPLWALAEDAFVARLLGGYGPYPAYFNRLRDVNRRGAGALRDPDEIGAAALAAEMARGSVVVDARPVEQWCEAHLRGALSNALRPQFAVWLGWVVPFGSRIAIVGSSTGEAREAAGEAQSIGFDDIAGVHRADPDAWRAAGLEVTAVPNLPPAAAREAFGDGWEPLDVREPTEVASGTLPGARCIALGALPAAAREITVPVVAFCGHGERAATALSILEAAGHRRLANLDGGFGAWREAALPVGSVS